MPTENTSSGSDPLQMRGAVDRPLRLRVRIFGAIAILAGVVVAVDLIQLDGRGTLPVLLALVAGLAVGLVASRIYALRWNADAKKVVGRIDALGAILLVGYIVVMLFRRQLVDIWVTAPVAGAAGFALLSRLMIGQVVGTVRGIIRLLLGNPRR